MSGLLDRAPAAGWDCHVHVFDADAPVQPGHYQPVHRPLEAAQALAQPHGFGHFVLVQPSVYGSDNTVLLRALRQSQGQHRGIVVLDNTATAAELQAMHALGVRGARFNLVSPVGNSDDTASSFQMLAPLFKALGWHVQWYARPQDLPGIAALHAGSGITAVLDHLGGMHADLPSSDPSWQALETLAEGGAWIKLSGWYRLGSSAPYASLDGNIQRVAQLFGQRMVWGSDWPHTSFAQGALPAYASLLEPVECCLPALWQQHVLSEAPLKLYA
jgi:predicted TIM-barrel fold metal-dependent hydrolase